MSLPQPQAGGNPSPSTVNLDQTRPAAPPMATAVPAAAPPRATAIPAAVPLAAGIPAAVASPPAAPAAKVIPAQAPTTTATTNSGARSADPIEEHEEGADWSTLIPSVLTSTVVHMALVLALALISFEQPQPSTPVTIVSTVTEETPLVEEFEPEELPTKPEMQENELTVESDAIVDNVNSTIDLPDTREMSFAAELSDATAATTEEFVNPTGDYRAIVGAPGNVGKGDSLTGRRSGRAGAANKNGGNKYSEEAVEKALKWLASVQGKDGGWNFDTRAVGSAATEPGSADQARSGATGLALLPFLAAGYTHKEKSQYQQVVYKGLDFLMQSTSKKYTNLQTGNVAWHEAQGTMYSHGIATMAICEAYGMTKDKTLLPFAQGGMNFISTAQDPAKGGWRYAPREPGDTSVVGWQLMALKSGAMSYLTVNPQTIKQATVFLNSVSSEKDYNAYYGYTGPGKGPATTAIGLLCRMHLGWKKDHQGLVEGVEYLSKMGPSKTNFYFNYYATQVMFQWGGEDFEKWNKVMRDQLISTQSTKGADAGSWHSGAKDHSTERGGRLYCTSLGTMILEVYYRYSKVLGKEAVEEAFPL